MWPSIRDLLARAKPHSIADMVLSSSDDVLVASRIDNGDWAEAELSEELTADAWRQRRCEHTGLSTGTHTVSVRAVDQDGNVQASERRPAIPGAATGLHERQFTVE